MYGGGFEGVGAVALDGGDDLGDPGLEGLGFGFRAGVDQADQAWEIHEVHVSSPLSTCGNAETVLLEHTLGTGEVGRCGNVAQSGSDMCVPQVLAHVDGREPVRPVRHGQSPHPRPRGREHEVVDVDRVLSSRPFVRRRVVLLVHRASPPPRKLGICRINLRRRQVRSPVRERRHRFCGGCHPGGPSARDKRPGA